MQVQVEIDASDPLVASGAVPDQPITVRHNWTSRGTLASTELPDVAGLGAEVVSTSYNQLLMPTGTRGRSGIVQAARYTQLGDLQQLQLGASTAHNAHQVYVTNLFERGTRRLAGSFTTTDTHPYRVTDSHYTYDPAGNVTSVFDKSTLGPEL